MKYLDAIRSQGDNLRDSFRSVRQSLAALDLGPWRSGRVALSGIGASYNAAMAAAPTDQARGLDVVPLLASHLFDPCVWRDVASVVAISQSGRSSETVSSLSGRGARSLCITDDPGSPLAEASSGTIRLGLLEDSPVRTLGYTATVQALGVLGDHLAARAPSHSWTPLPGAVEREVASAEVFGERTAEAVASCSAVDVVAGRARFGTAAQGALLFREACRVTSSAYDTHHYLHGPLEPASRGVAVVLIGAGRELGLADYLADAGATVLLITTADHPRHEGVLVHRVPDLGPGGAPILEVLSLQCLTWFVAQARGLAVDTLRHSQPDTKLSAGRT